MIEWAAVEGKLGWNMVESSGGGGGLEIKMAVFVNSSPIL